jgi:hypothetical protein
VNPGFDTIEPRNIDPRAATPTPFMPPRRIDWCRDERERAAQR